MLAEFARATGNVDLAMITPRMIGDYKSHMLVDNKTATTINDHLSILRGFFWLLHQQQACAHGKPGRRDEYRLCQQSK